jgi:hypothetical protein
VALFPRIHSIGDSITAGVDAGTGQSNGYRYPLLNLLLADGRLPTYAGNLSIGSLLPAYAQWHSGYGGQNCASIKALWSAAHGTVVRSAYVYLLQAGTNDVRTDLGPNPNVNQDWDALFDVVLGQAQGALVVAAIPTPLAVSADDARVVLLGTHILSQVALRRSQGNLCIAVNMHDALNNTTDLSDGIHPTDSSGYPKMAAVWYAAISRYL